MDPLHPPVPPVSTRNEPRFRSAERKSMLAAAFADQGAYYDRLRPGYPSAVLDAMLAAATPDPAATAPAPAPGIPDPVSSTPDPDARISDPASTTPDSAPRIADPVSSTPDPDARISDPASTTPDRVTPVAPLRAVDLGAGTGKLSWALVDRGCAVTAVDTSEAMLETALRRDPSAAPAGPTGDDARPSAPQLSTPTGPPAPEITPRSGSPVSQLSTPSGSPVSQLSTPSGSPVSQLTTSSGSPVPRLTTQVARAEATGLPAASADLVTVAQAWHWFDADAATAEAARLLRPGGVLALVWNTLDVQIPWVHRLSRIMHAGDVQRDDFTPPVGAPFTLLQRIEHRWEDPMPTQDVIDLARTRSYVITATEERRAKVLSNLDWYLHDHLGHASGSIVGVPYRTDLFLYRADG